MNIDIIDDILSLKYCSIDIMHIKVRVLTINIVVSVKKTI